MLDIRTVFSFVSGLLDITALYDSRESIAELMHDHLGDFCT